MKSKFVQLLIQGGNPCMRIEDACKYLAHPEASIPLMIREGLFIYFDGKLVPTQLFIDYMFKELGFEIPEEIICTHTCGCRTKHCCIYHLGHKCECVFECFHSNERAMA